MHKNTNLKIHTYLFWDSNNPKNPIGTFKAPSVLYAFKKFIAMLEDDERIFVSEELFSKQQVYEAHEFNEGTYYLPTQDFDYTFWTEKRSPNTRGFNLIQYFIKKIN